MPNPKRKHSKMRSRTRRTHYKATAPSVATCPKCSHPKLTHRACANCGYYAGKYVVTKTENA